LSATPLYFTWVGTITGLDTTGLDYWTRLLDSTTGLTQTAKYTSFSAEQKLNVLIHCYLISFNNELQQ